MGEFIRELWAFMKERKKFWLLPIVVVQVSVLYRLAVRIRLVLKFN